MRCRRGLLQLAGEGPCLFRAQACRRGLAPWLVLGTSWSPSGQATATTLGLACAGDAPLAAARARIMRPPGSSVSIHPSTRLHACLLLWQMGCRGGRVASSHQKTSHRFAPLRPAKTIRPKEGIARVGAPYWHRLVRPVQFLLAVAVHSWRICRIVHGIAAQVRDMVATPTAWSGRRASAVHKGETQFVDD